MAFEKCNITFFFYSSLKKYSYPSVVFTFCHILTTNLHVVKMWFNVINQHKVLHKLIVRFGAQFPAACDILQVDLKVNLWSHLARTPCSRYSLCPSYGLWQTSKEASYSFHSMMTASCHLFHNGQTFWLYDWYLSYQSFHLSSGFLWLIQNYVGRWLQVWCDVCKITREKIGFKLSQYHSLIYNCLNFNLNI